MSKNTSSGDNVTTASESKVNYAVESNLLKMVSSNAKRWRHPSVSCDTDKYDLDLRFRPRHREHIASAHHCDTFKL